MLQVAKKKLPDVALIQGDMALFDLGKQFDVIICMFDSINHLLDFGRWEAMFASVAKHLRPNGLFIFDMNTLEKLAQLNTNKPYIQEINGNRVEMRNSKGDDDTSVFNIKLYKAGQLIGEEHIPEVSFPLDKVQAALGKHFNILEKVLHTHGQPEPPDYDDKAYFIGRNRAPLNK